MDERSIILPDTGMPNLERRVRNLLSTILLKLRPDRTFSLSGSTVIEGKWRLEGGRVLLVPNPTQAEGAFTIPAEGVKLEPAPADRLRLQQATPFGASSLELKRTG